MLNGNLIDLNDLPISEWNRIIALAQEIIKRPELYSEKCYGKILATLFYEPSTRTQMSFQTAMLKLGGRIIGFDDPQNSSVSKGESLKDTITIVSNYADMIVLRHPNEGAARAASLYASCPVINAGDGGHLHPSQTLTDLLTLSVEKGRLTDLVVGICGDLVNGRTVHSLIKALSCYRGNSFVLISTPNLRVPSYIKDIMSAAGCPFTEVDSLSEAIPMLDVLYMTRIQRERFTSEEEYLREKDVYRLDREKLMSARSDLRILHPLPRVDEIAIEVDDDPRAAYFRQASYGVYARMALLIR
ncbi:MAG: aspartate carbamoyltransferase, partial [Ruminococcaceae bacterium]|nr:aspartate carbamoyltransferase [Oscillospiraceae bacterium]